MALRLPTFARSAALRRQLRDQRGAVSFVEAAGGAVIAAIITIAMIQGGTGVFGGGLKGAVGGGMKAVGAADAAVEADADTAGDPGRAGSGAAPAPGVPDPLAAAAPPPPTTAEVSSTRLTALDAVARGGFPPPELVPGDESERQFADLVGVLDSLTPAPGESTAADGGSETLSEPFMGTPIVEYAPGYGPPPISAYPPGYFEAEREFWASLPLDEGIESMFARIRAFEDAHPRPDPVLLDPVAAGVSGSEADQQSQDRGTAEGNEQVAQVLDAITALQPGGSGQVPDSGLSVGSDPQATASGQDALALLLGMIDGVKVDGQDAAPLVAGVLEQFEAAGATALGGPLPSADPAGVEEGQRQLAELFGVLDSVTPDDYGIASPNQIGETPALTAWGLGSESLPPGAGSTTSDATGSSLRQALMVQESELWNRGAGAAAGDLAVLPPGSVLGAPSAGGDPVADLVGRISEIQPAVEALTSRESVATTDLAGTLTVDGATVTPSTVSGLLASLPDTPLTPEVTGALLPSSGTVDAAALETLFGEVGRSTEDGAVARRLSPDANGRVPISTLREALAKGEIRQTTSSLAAVLRTAEGDEVPGTVVSNVVAAIGGDSSSVPAPTALATVLDASPDINPQALAETLGIPEFATVDLASLRQPPRSFNPVLLPDVDSTFDALARSGATSESPLLSSASIFGEPIVGDLATTDLLSNASADPASGAGSIFDRYGSNLIASAGTPGQIIDAGLSGGVVSDMDPTGLGLVRDEGVLVADANPGVVSDSGGYLPPMSPSDATVSTSAAALGGPISVNAETAQSGFDLSSDPTFATGLTVDDLLAAGNNYTFADGLQLGSGTSDTPSSGQFTVMPFQGEVTGTAEGNPPVTDDFGETVDLVDPTDGSGVDLRYQDGRAVFGTRINEADRQTVSGPVFEPSDTAPFYTVNAPTVGSGDGVRISPYVALPFGSDGQVTGSIDYDTANGTVPSAQFGVGVGDVTLGTTLEAGAPAITADVDQQDPFSTQYSLNRQPLDIANGTTTLEVGDNFGLGVSNRFDALTTRIGAEDGANVLEAGVGPNGLTADGKVTIDFGNDNLDPSNPNARFANGTENIYATQGTTNTLALTGSVAENSATPGTPPSVEVGAELTLGGTRFDDAQVAQQNRNFADSLPLEIDQAVADFEGRGGLSGAEPVVVTPEPAPVPVVVPEPVPVPVVAPAPVPEIAPVTFDLPAVPFTPDVTNLQFSTVPIDLPELNVSDFATPELSFNESSFTGGGLDIGNLSIGGSFPAFGGGGFPF